MKSAHRHQLETNVLAKRIENYLDRFRPYVSTIAGVLIAIILLLLVWSYFSGSSAARHSGAWDEYNRAVSMMPPNLEQLNRAAEEHPNTKMQQMADVTWADGQVWMASRNYIYNRAAAMEALSKATSAYQDVIQSSNDEQLTGRARLGLARIYEMQNELDKARDQYKQVTGGYVRYAQAQAERLARPDAKETYAWLASAKPPRPQSPMGPGTPGQRPEFSPGDISLPNAPETDPGKATGTTSEGDAFEQLLKTMKDEGRMPETPDRYLEGEKPATESTPVPPANDATTGEPQSVPAPPPSEQTKETPETGSAPGDDAKK